MAWRLAPREQFFETALGIAPVAGDPAARQHHHRQGDLREVVRCNSAVGRGVDVQAGAVSGAEFSSNLVRTWSFGKLLDRLPGRRR